MRETRLSGDARAVLARGAHGDDELRELLMRLGAADSRERRAFWLGVMVRDGALTVREALRVVDPTALDAVAHVAQVAAEPAVGPPPNGRRCQICDAPLTGRSFKNCGSEACLKERARRYQARYAERAAAPARPGDTLAGRSVRRDW